MMCGTCLDEYVMATEISIGMANSWTDSYRYEDAGIYVYIQIQIGITHTRKGKERHVSRFGCMNMLVYNGCDDWRHVPTGESSR